VKTDIERLHKVVNKELQGRGVGKTFAKCHDVAGLIQTTDVKYIFCMISLKRDMDYILPMLERVLEEHGLTFYHKLRTELVVNGVTIKFIREDDFDQRTRGYDNYAIVRMRHWD